MLENVDLREKPAKKPEPTSDRSHHYSAVASRLRNDYLQIKSDPVPYVTAEPVHRNIYEWHFVLEGPEDTPYEGGFYHGKILFPTTFPFAPPAVYFITPNGRFKTDIKLCFSFSDAHPETWNPAWNVSTILTGLLSFMTEDKPLANLKHMKSDRQRLANNSLKFNLRNKTFCTMFPQIVDKIQEIMRRKTTSGGTVLPKSSSFSRDGDGACHK